MSQAARLPLVGYTSLLPWLIGFPGLTLGPTPYLSFTSYNLLSSLVWIGVSRSNLHLVQQEGQRIDEGTGQLRWI